MVKHKLIRVTTVPESLDVLLKGQLHYMSAFYDVLAVSSPGEKLKLVGKREQVRTIPLEMTRSITLRKDIRALWQLFRLFRRESPLIVHTHTPKAGTAGMLAAWLARVPVRMHTVAGLPLLEAKGMKRIILYIMEKITYACATGVYPNSIGLRDIIENERLSRPEKLKVISSGSSNGIDTAYFDPASIKEEERTSLRNELGISREDFVFIFVGRMVGDKGVNELVEAFESISTDNLHAKLLLVGPFESHLDPLKSQTMKVLGQNQRIITVGLKDDVRPYFAISDILVFPSYREGFPNVVMQAGAMGLPSIVTDINGCNEIIIHGENGLIIPPKNTLAVARAMEAVLNDVELRERLGSRSREMVCSRYERQVLWDALLDEYRSLESKYGDV